MCTQNRTPEISSHLAKQNSQINTATELRLIIFCKPLMTPRYLQFFFLFLSTKEVICIFSNNILPCVKNQDFMWKVIIMRDIPKGHSGQYLDSAGSPFSATCLIQCLFPCTIQILNQIWRPCNNAVNYHNINLWIKITDKRGDRSRSNNSACEDMFSSLFTKYKNS